MPYKESKRIYISKNDDKRISDIQFDLSKVKNEIYSKMRIISELLDEADKIFFDDKKHIIDDLDYIINKDDIKDSGICKKINGYTTDNIRNERDEK